MDNFMEDLFSHGWITTFNKHRNKIVAEMVFEADAMDTEIDPLSSRQVFVISARLEIQDDIHHRWQLYRSHRVAYCTGYGHSHVLSGLLCDNRLMIYIYHISTWLIFRVELSSDMMIMMMCAADKTQHFDHQTPPG